MKRSVIKIGFKGKSIGVNSEWVRHYVQNVFAHGFIPFSKQRMFPMLSNDWIPISTVNMGQPNSKFTTWGL